ncbi:DEAD/DEAH box helicase, partial [Vibrio anguillarum]|nr:DEAD/DEAH box helicase [Vibrio anguillarum]
FKQIIGRGTRIDERYGKLWFTILDFKKATELFADERFDGTPERVKVTTPKQFEDEDDLDDIIEGMDDIDADNPFGDEDIDSDSIQEPESSYGDNFGGSSKGGAEGNDDWNDENRVRKFHVNGVSVKALAERVQYYDSDGKLVTESFKDYTRKTMVKQFASLNDFIKRWN